MQMEYSFKMEITPADYWVLTMTGIYRSFVGVINIVFTAAMAALAIRFMGRVDPVFEGMIVFGLSVFPVLHPIAIYGMSIKQTEHMPKDVELSFDRKGMRVRDGAMTERIPYTKVTRLQKRNNMIIIMTDGSHGYMLTNRVLGDKKDALYNDLISWCKKDHI